MSLAQICATGDVQGPSARKEDAEGTDETLKAAGVVNASSAGGQLPLPVDAQAVLSAQVAFYRGWPDLRGRFCLQSVFGAKTQLFDSGKALFNWQAQKDTQFWVNWPGRTCSFKFSLLLCSNPFPSSL